MTNEEIDRIVQQLKVVNETSLARLNQHLQSMLPVYDEETATGSAVGPSSVGIVTINPERDTYFKVTGIYVSVPINTVSATLQLGHFYLPLQNTTTLLCPVQKILVSTDRRQLTFATGAGDDDGGAGTVWLWGEAIPKYGKL